MKRKVSTTCCRSKVGRSIHSGSSGRLLDTPHLPGDEQRLDLLVQRQDPRQEGRIDADGLGGDRARSSRSACSRGRSNRRRMKCSMKSAGILRESMVMGMSSWVKKMPCSCRKSRTRRVLARADVPRAEGPQQVPPAEARRVLLEAPREEQLGEVALEMALGVGLRALEQVLGRDVALDELEGRVAHVLVDVDVLGSNPAGRR